MPRSTNLSVATMGIDIGKNSFHVVGLDQRGAIVVRQRWTRSQIRARLANMPPRTGSSHSVTTAWAIPQILPHT
jgi:transposase